jgi:O-antigen ligase
VNSFLLALVITIFLSYAIWFEVIPPFKEANIFDPTPFMSHVSYNPILLFGIYLAYHETIFNKNLTKLKKFLYCGISIAMSFNMFITLGRAGQVAFFLMVSIFIFQCFRFKKIKAFFLILIIVPSIFITAYQSSDYFKLRVDNTIVAASTFNENNFTSLGIRLRYAINSWELIKENPLIGVGTGDLPTELNKINAKNSPNMPLTTNPHNMYTLILVELGLLGFISLMSILYYQIKLSFEGSNKFIRDFGLTLPLLFSVLMLSDSYLLGHYTSLLFVFFSSFLYKDFERY